MATLCQRDLPKDPVSCARRRKHNHVRVYSHVARGGVIRRGDPVRLE